MRNNRATEDILEAQNREYAERMSSKTSYLKSVAYDIEKEARDHNRFLDGVDNDFDSTSGLLGGTLNRVNLMMSSGRSNRKLTCYVAMGFICVVFFIYKLLDKLFRKLSDHSDNVDASASSL